MTWRNNRTNCRNFISSNPATSENPKQILIVTGISKNKLELFDLSSVKKTRPCKGTNCYSEKELLFVFEVFLAARQERAIWKNFFLHENQSCPPSLSQNGTLRPGNKSDLLKCLEKVHPLSSEVPATDAVILASLMELPLLIWCSQGDARPSKTMQKIVSYRTSKWK